MRLFLFLFAISIIFCSCNNDKAISTNAKDTTNISDEGLIFYEIENEVLFREIEMFIDSSICYNYLERIFISTYGNKKRFDGSEEHFDSSHFNALINIINNNKIVELYIDNFEDTMECILYHPLCPPWSFSEPSRHPLMTFSKVKETIVLMEYWNIKGIKLPEDAMWKYIKDCFPEGYKIYQNNKDTNNVFIPQKIALGGGLEWHLKFKDGKLVKKEEWILE